jgi:hypothetical protein
VSRTDELLDLFAGTEAAPPPAPPPVPPPRPARRPAPAAPAQRKDPEEAARVLAAVQAVAPHFRRVVFTRNRRVMASAAERGTALRLNAAFAAAPLDVLEAVARLFSTRDRRARRRAREVVLDFVRGIPAPHGRPRRRRRSPHPGDGPILARLRAEFDRVNAACFGGALPAVPLHLSGRMRRRNGHFATSPLEIVISRRLCTDAEDGEAERTLRHEMIHLWQHASGRKPDHGPEFRAWARRLDVHPRATRPVAWKNGG